ncbi:hypothetical protein [Peristeroidobacter soli]|uniref:hypothetical protein n=1 Tax=Peristeroidobacter soli TaxID=2497877 RepID=UPI00101C156E|nr:hypothetical protein [Peristeroidobacter soli]
MRQRQQRLDRAEIMERLPLVPTLTEAVHRYREQFPALLRVIALPALAHAVVLSVWYRTTQEDQLLVIFLWAVQGFLMTLAAISCHRVILLGAESVPSLGASGTTARDWRFIGIAAALFVVTNLLLQFATLAIFIPLGLLKPGLVPPGSEWTLPIARIAALPALYVACRYAICLPAMAIDRPLPPKEAWLRTRGHGMRLLLLIGVSPWLLHFIQRSLAGSFSSSADYVVAGNVLLWLLLPLEIALLSICYRRLG